MATTLKSNRNPDAEEDAILRKIYLVTLTGDDIKSDSRVVYLETTAAEMLSEDKDLKLCRESMERVLFDRLSGDFAKAEQPFQYLVGCFRRACEEEEKIRAMKDKNVRSEIELAVKQTKKFAVSYCKLYLGNPGMFPNRDSGNNPDASPLLDPDATSFIAELFKEGDYDSMEPINRLYEVLRGSVEKVSALGNFQQPLNVFRSLIKNPVGAKVLVDQLKGLSNLNGRDIAMNSILGAFLHVSGLPDPNLDFESEPDVGKECFIKTSLAADVRTVMNKLQDDLADALKDLLRNKGLRENVLQYMAELINKNASRAHIQVDPSSCASSGTFVNLSAVMLRLCEPFLIDPIKRNKIDPRYVLDSNRLELRRLTAIHATSDQVSGWSKKSGNPDQEFHFICECFFMTARVLNLGLVKTFSHIRHLAATVRTSKDTLSLLKAVQDKSPSTLLQQEIAKLEEEIESYSREIWCYETQVLDDKGLLQRALSFYRLMVVWMVDLAGGFKIPAPATCPMHFAAIPEHFVDDAMEFLIFVFKVKALDRVELADFMSFIIMFMGSPGFIQNPYLRTKMVEVLNCWIPNKSANDLFKGHQPVLDHLVRNLLQLYADIESTGSHSQFYDKFNIRHNISTLLKYLWEIPSHRNAWIRIAKVEAKGSYLQFLNFLMNDSIYLLDEGMNKIMKTEQLEAPAERSSIKWTMVFANEDIDMISFTSDSITAPFLLPEMVERVSSMLNYFLSQLVMIFQRKSTAPALKDPEKYGFRPRELLRQIVKIYVNLERGDRENVFAAAITKDGRSYSEELFGAAAEELKKNGEEAMMIRGFLELGRKAKAATKQAEEAELALGEIPEEFMDPIMSTLMTDPVILPNTNVRIDRPVILRHLLSKSTDPFSGLPLTADMLIPDNELKAKINRFLQNELV